MKEYYGIIQSTSVYHEGDERSRTCPGHGYPAYSETFTTLKEFTLREEWEKEIKRLSKPAYGTPEKFRAIIFHEVEISTEVKINTKP